MNINMNIKILKIKNEKSHEESHVDGQYLKNKLIQIHNRVYK